MDYKKEKGLCGMTQIKTDIDNLYYNRFGHKGGYIANRYAINKMMYMKITNR